MTIQQRAELESHIGEIVRGNPECLLVEFQPTQCYLGRAYPVFLPMGIEAIVRRWRDDCTAIFGSHGYTRLSDGCVWLSPAGRKVWDHYKQRQWERMNRQHWYDPDYRGQEAGAKIKVDENYGSDFKSAFSSMAEEILRSTSGNSAFQDVLRQTLEDMGIKW